MTKRAVGHARRATDKRVVGSAQNPRNVHVSGGASTAELKLIQFNDRRASRGAGRPKKVR